MGKQCKRLITLLLSLALLLSSTVTTANTARAADRGNGEMQSLRFEKVEDSEELDHFDGSAAVEEQEETPAIYADTDVVRVSILLDKASTIEAGYPLEGIAANTQAMRYRNELAADQSAVEARISRSVLNGGQLDTVWNLTLAANIISANVEFGKMEAIRNVPGVRDVILETRYEPAVIDGSEAADPNMSTSPGMIGSTAAWAAGYTGAGTRIAVIDTGIDTNHQSFSPEGFEHSLRVLAEESQESYETFAGGLNLLDETEISSVLSKLNASASSADQLYVNTKIPFGYNYVDSNREITHDKDNQGEHGSHVEGIAAANRFIPVKNEAGETTYEKALDTVLVQGVAPDAQILAMKVFGANGGAYDSDYFAAVEDAILLEADSINLSLGSAYPGFTRNAVYEELLDSLTACGAVVVMSAGNSGGWADSAATSGRLYSDDVSMDTVGSPGSYVNPLTVASADNVGTTGEYFTYGDGNRVFYNESIYNQDPLTSLTGEQEYVFFDNVGVDAENNDLLSPYKEAIQDKVVFVSRGESNFLDKQRVVSQAGGKACIVCNNQKGSMGMDLSNGWVKIPCVIILQADAGAIKAASKPVTDEEGNILYYTGTIDITGKISSTVYNDPYAMSSFSSWGVPGTLLMKPEITAPGGSIYSVNGAVEDGTAYETMSGTSMAAPQVTGMAALAAQRIRGEGLAEGAGFTVRQLVQSLLMSTAVPMRDADSGDNYYPVLQQGAGLANVGAAVSAKSYIKMGEDATDSYADGKVKAELGDDPGREGVYAFTFSLNNLTDEARTYVLGGSFFTQSVYSMAEDSENEDSAVRSYLSTSTTPVAADVTFTVDGKEYLDLPGFACDLDQDGDTDADDAQVILNYLAGLREDIDAGTADVDGDGDVTTYDAYLLLRNRTYGTLELPAGGSVEIAVKAVYSEQVKSYLDKIYPNGAYVEGYITVEPTSTAEGAVSDVSHSIPVLGFYGNWSDASMFDKTSYTGSLYNDDPAPYTGLKATNNLVVVRRGYPPQQYWAAGNPYFVEPEYPAGREAIRSIDTLYAWRYSLIRNAGAVGLRITNSDGEVIYSGEVEQNVIGAFYYANGGTWANTYLDYMINQRVSELGLEEGDSFTVSLYAVPELYTGGGMTEEQFDALLESGELGKGIMQTATLRVDDTAPTISKVYKDTESGNLLVQAKDNQWISSVQVWNASNTRRLAQALSSQTKEGEETYITVDLTDVAVGKRCLVIVTDYAGNESTFSVEYNGENEDYSGRMFAFTNVNMSGQNGPRWYEIDPETLNYTWSLHSGMELVGSTDLIITAAEYVGGYVYMAGSDGNIYVAEQGAWGDYKYANTYSGKLGEISDMAFDYENDTLYAVGWNSETKVNEVYSVDLTTCELKPEFTVTLKVDGTEQDSYHTIEGLAITDDGVFYAVNAGSSSNASLYKWTLENVTTAEEDAAFDTITDVEPVGEGRGIGKNLFKGSLAWDHDNNKLYVTTCMLATGTGTNDNNVLMEINPEDGKAANTNPNGNSSIYAPVVGMYIVPSRNYKVDMVDQPTEVVLSQTEVEVLTGMALELEADVYPWNLRDDSVTWTSSDEAVVTVSDGYVTVVGAGEATVTAAANADENVKAECKVTVAEPPVIDVSGLVFDADRTPHWAEFKSDAPDKRTDVQIAAREYLAGGALLDGVLYVHDEGTIYGIDPDNFAETNYGPIAADWLWTDAAPAPRTEDGAFGKLVTIADGGLYLDLLDPAAGTVSRFTMFSSYTPAGGYNFGDDPMAAIALKGASEYNRYGTMCPCYDYYVISENGALCLIQLYYESNSESYSNVVTFLGYTNLILGSASDLYGKTSASMTYDAESGYLVLANRNGGHSAQLTLIDPEMCLTAQLGEFGENVWPVTSLYQYERVTELTVRVTPKKASVYAGDTYQLTSRVLPDTFDSAVEWSSSDEGVATVDETGLVTAVAGGTVTITATSKATNEQQRTASAACEITVMPLENVNLTFNAQVTDKDGRTYWSKLDTSDLSSIEHLSEEEAVQFVGGGAHDGKLYGTGTDDTLYRYDPADGYSETKGSVLTSSVDASVDGTTSPQMTAKISKYVTGQGNVTEDVSVFGHPVIWLEQQGLVFLTEFDGEETEGTASHGWGFIMEAATYFGGIPAGAIAYVGSTGEGGSSPTQSFKVLSVDGRLWDVSVNYFYMSYRDPDPTGSAHYSFRASRPNNSTNGKLGITFDDFTKLSMEYVDDGTNKGLLIAYSGDDQVELYWVDLADSNNPRLGKIGNVPDAAAVTALYTEHSLNSGGMSGEAPAQTESGEPVEFPMLFSRGYEEQMAGGASEQSVVYSGVTGSTSSTAPGTDAGGEDTPAVERAAVTADAGTVRLTLAEIEAATNGLIKVTYAPDKLTFKEAGSPVANYAAGSAEAGVVIFDYATLQAIAAGDTLAVLDFTYTSDGLDTTLTVETLERGSSTDVAEEPLELSISVAPTVTPNPPEPPTPGGGSTPGGAPTPGGGSTAPERPFLDVAENAWYDSAVEYVYEKGLMKGVSERIFDPDAATTRAHMWTVLARLAGQDVDGASPWYAKARAWSMEAEVSDGTMPNDNITREQIVTMLWRYLGEPEAESGLSAFTDHADVSDWAEAAMTWAVGAGIIEGRGGNLLKPREFATRAEVAAILMRFCENTGK